MNRQNYRAAFDAVDFSPDFEERTLQKLAAMRHASEKEQNKMSMNRTKKITLLAAAAVFGTIWGLSHSLAAAGPVGEAAALVLLALLWLLSEQPWRKKKGRSAAAEPGVTIQGSSLERYQEALEDFCRAMKTRPCW